MGEVRHGQHLLEATKRAFQGQQTIFLAVMRSFCFYKFNERDERSMNNFADERGGGIIRVRSGWYFA